MEASQVTEFWLFFKDYIDRKQVEIIAEKYVEMCADYGVDDDTFKDCIGNDHDLDKAIMYYLDIEEESEYEDE